MLKAEGDDKAACKTKQPAWNQAGCDEYGLKSLFGEQMQSPRHNVFLNHTHNADKGTEYQAVFHGEAEQFGFLTL